MENETQKENIRENGKFAKGFRMFAVFVIIFGLGFYFGYVNREGFDTCTG